MDQSVCNNQASYVHDNTPGQPELRQYKLWFWAEGFAAVDCEVENEEQAKDWFFHYYERHDGYECHEAQRIDNLGVVKAGQSVQELSHAEFLATARELKAAHAARLEKAEVTQPEPSTAQDETPSSEPKATPRQPEVRCYRIWYSFVEERSVECEAESEEKAVEWFFQERQKHDGGITIYTLDRIEDVDAEAARPSRERDEMAAWESVAWENYCKSSSNEPGLVKDDLYHFHRNKQLKEEAKRLKEEATQRKEKAK